MSRPVTLMCPPDHFSVYYRINPWMQPRQWAEQGPQLIAGARAGWHRLVETLRGLGAHVMMLPAQPQLPDLIFTANAAVVLDGTALLARFRYPQRTGEEPHVARFFEQLRATNKLQRVVELPPGVVLEGAGDCVWDSARRLFWTGYGPRSDARASEVVRSVFATPVVELELVNPRYYHLDTCLCVLEGGQVLYVPEAFSLAGLQRIYAYVP
jgi:N-dimethylarginine dimethylaminohydrolase